MTTASNITANDVSVTPRCGMRAEIYLPSNHIIETKKNWPAINKPVSACLSASYSKMKIININGVGEYLLVGQNKHQKKSKQSRAKVTSQKPR